MHVSYNFQSLQLEHTSEVSIEPVMDESGMDLLYQRVTLHVIAVWNPWATASGGGAGPVIPNQPDINPSPNTNGPLDRLGVTIANLEEILMQPQRPLRVWIAQDRVWDVPEIRTAPNPVGVGPTQPQTMAGLGAPGAGAQYQAACDPAGGPFPLYCRILEIHGDKTAIVSWGVQFHVNTQCDHYVLSNRWRVTSQVGADWLTTRVTEGRAVVRLDKMLQFGFNIDQFRSQVALSVPNGFIRKEVNVVATEDGREFYYRVVDKQQAIKIPFGTPALRVEGHITTGAAWPFKSVVQGLKQVGGGIRHAFNAIMAAALDWNPVAAIEQALNAATVAADMLPHARAMGVIRVYGPAGVNTNKASMAALAINLLLDRLAQARLLGTVFFPLSAFLTQNLSSDDQPMVEVQMEALVSALDGLSAIWNPQANLAKMQRTSEVYLDQQGNTAMTFSNATVTPAFPGSLGTRGTWLGSLITQILKVGCSVGVVPAPDPQFDVTPATADANTINV